MLHRPALTPVSPKYSSPFRPPLPPATVSRRATAAAIHLVAPVRPAAERRPAATAASSPRPSSSARSQPPRVSTRVRPAGTGRDAGRAVRICRGQVAGPRSSHRLSPWMSCFLGACSGTPPAGASRYRAELPAGGPCRSVGTVTRPPADLPAAVHAATSTASCRHAAPPLNKRRRYAPKRKRPRKAATPRCRRRRAGRTVSGRVPGPASPFGSRPAGG